MNKIFLIFLVFGMLNQACITKNSTTIQIEQWKEVELVFYATGNYPNPYTDVEFWVNFTGPNNEQIIRPGFWDQGQTWKVRFTSPSASGFWQWTSHASNPADSGLHGKTGSLVVKPYSGSNSLIARGLLQISPGKRNVIHADGSPFLM